MESSQTTPVLDGRPPETAAASNDATAASREATAASKEATALREAMLAAIGDLSDAEREQLGSASQPDQVAQAWRDLIAQRAAREREATVRTELTREFEERTRAAQPRPTSGLHGGAPPTPPSTVAEWTDFIRSTDTQPIRQQRRAQFANWLAAHPEA